ncbi:MAG: hypothetical protein ACE5MH_07320 [Terriglobia bacterium]
MKTRKYRKAVFAAALLSALWLLPVAAAAQVEEAQARIDGMV